MFLKKLIVKIGNVFLFACVWGACSIAQAQGPATTDLLIHLNATNLLPLANGATVSSWSNACDFGGSFIPAVSGQGAVFQTNVAGAAAVTFAGTANSVMTNTVPPPMSILTNNTWSFEIWAFNPTLDAAVETMLAWTPRDNLTDNNLTVMEVRYGYDTSECIEHFGSYNISWGGAVPLRGAWHYVAATRADDGTEKLFVDGVLRVTASRPTLKLATDGSFTLGGVWSRSAKTWASTMFFSGSLGCVRVHDGTLTDAQVVSNYLAESTMYQSVWSGAAGVRMPWSDSANWLGGNVAKDGGTASITNGGTAVLSNDLSLNHLYPTAGGLVVTNGASVCLGGVDTVYLANAGGFALSVVDGSLAMPGTNNVNLYMGLNGGGASVAVGGTGASAVLDVDRDTILANSSGSAGTMTVGAGGAVYNSNGWFYVANNIGASGSLTVDGGEIGFRTASKNFVVNVNGAQAEVMVNSGAIRATGDFQWSAGTSTNVSVGTVHLNGGEIEAKRFFAVSTAGTNRLYLNGGTMRALDSRTDFFYNLTAAYVQSGGVTFDIPVGLTVTAAQALLEDAVSTGGGLTKTGAGRITFSGANTFTGPIDVLAGDLYFSATNGLPDGYAGAVTLTHDATASIGCAKAGGATQLRNCLDTNSVGYLTLFAANATDTVDFATFPYMKLAFSGAFDYTGTFIPYQGAYTYKIESSIITNSAVLADAGTIPGHLDITGVSGGGMVLNGDNTFTGGTRIDAAIVTLGNANALGYQATPGEPDIVLRNGAVLRFVADMDINALVTGRLTTASSGILLVGAANAAKNIDLSNHPGIVVGSAETTLNYTGTLTPATALEAYTLGGGNAVYSGQSYHGFSVSNLTDGAAVNKVVVGTPGIVELKTGNTYSGGTVVTNRGVLFLASDGLGAVPETADSDNLYVDNGVIRSGNANFTLDARRGLTVGPNGMELHPWGGYAMTVAGNLAGSGAITMTDGGYVTFAGSGNTYNGKVTLSVGNFRIGDGANFTWGSTGGITDNATLRLKTDAEKSFGDAVSGYGSVRKEGAGALTLAQSQTYSGATYIDAGTLRVSSESVLPQGSGKGAVEIASGAFLETDGRDLRVGGLRGVGAVTNRTGAVGALYVGATNLNASFSGLIDPSLTFTKVGLGTQTLANAQAVGVAEVRGGTLECFGATSITNTLTLAGGTLEVTYGTMGLIGKYYSLSAAPVTSDFVSYAAITNFLADKTPSVVSNSIGFGSTFNATSTGTRFPSPYSIRDTSNFAVWWTGLFCAEKTGDYGFATASDDGSMLFIDGQTVVNNNAMQGFTWSDSNLVATVTLEKGMHEIAIAFYEGGGDQGLTVWVTRPGGTQQELPNALLFTGLDTGETQVGTLAGDSGDIRFADSGSATLRITDAADMTYGGTVTGSNIASRLVKESAGTLTLSASGSDYYGELDIQSGDLVLTNGASMFGMLSLAGGTSAKAYGQNGLQMYFYNRSTSNNDYSKFQSMAAWEAYLSTTFPAGPNYVTNSLMLGANLDTGAAGTAWPTPYVQSSGAESDTFDSYWFGRIFLSQSGTYTFATGSDDGSMLFIDRKLVVNNGYDQGVTQRSGTITLTAGFHAIDILYRENTGGNALQVYIAYPGGSLSMMPQSILFGGAALHGLSGESGSTFDLAPSAVVSLLQSVDTTFAGVFAGDASTLILKDGAGTLTLTGDNAAFTGAYSVVGGVLRVGDGGTVGSLGPTASVSIGADGALIFDRDGTSTVGGTISGTGIIQLDGPGDVYVTSTNSFAGTVIVNNGRLVFGPGATLGAASTITNTTTVEVETSGSVTSAQIVNDLVGDGDLEVTGDGTLVMNDSTSYTGTTRVHTGATLQVSKPVNLGGGGDVALEGGTLEIKPDVEAGTNQIASALDSGTWTLNGYAAWTNRSNSQWVRLTQNLASQAGSAFYNTKVTPYVPWFASFRYEVGAHPVGAADGATFLLQNSSLTALGASGGQLGASGITPSIGIFFNIYQTPTVGWIVNGSRVDADSALNGIVLTNGVDVSVSYNGTDLKVTVEQDGKVYTSTRTVDLYTTFSGNTAYVGFTGGTGGATAEQFVGNFEMTDAVPTSTDFDNDITVADGQSGNLSLVLVNDDTSFGFSGFELGTGAVLTVSAGAGSKADAGYTVAASNITVAAGTATVNVAANGGGTGVLALNTLVIGNGAKLVVTGAVSAPDGVLTIVVPTPLKKGITYLADFTGATWVGETPTFMLVDENGDPIDEVVTLRNGLLYINTIRGTVIFVQ